MILDEKRLTMEYGCNFFNTKVNLQDEKSCYRLVDAVEIFLDDADRDSILFKERTLALLSCSVYVLSQISKNGKGMSNVQGLFEYLNINRLKDCLDTKSDLGIDEKTKTMIRNYLTSLPGFYDFETYRIPQIGLDDNQRSVSKLKRVLTLLSISGKLFSYT